MKPSVPSRKQDRRKLLQQKCHFFKRKRFGRGAKKLFTGKEKLKKIRKIIKTKKKKDKPGSAVMEAVSGLSFFAIFLRL